MVQNCTFQKDVSDRGRNDIPSPREIGLLQLLARGCINKQAAEELSLSPHTIGGHVRSINRNLGVSSHGEAVMRLSQRIAALVKTPVGPTSCCWRRALIIVLGAQLLFWSAYALFSYSLRPPDALEADRLTSEHVKLAAGGGQMGAYVLGLSEPAVLRIPGWRPVVIYPARASVLLRAQTDESGPWSLSCLRGPCEINKAAYAGPLPRMEAAAYLERFQRYDIVWIDIAVAVVVGVALLILLPISRFSRLQTVAGVFLILLAPDAWLTSFGTAELPYAWFPVLRYGAEFLLLTSMSITVNAFAGWRVREAWAAGACFAFALAMLTGTLLTAGDFTKVVPLLEAAALALLFGHGLVAMLRLFRSAPGPAFRALAVLFVALASVGYDVFFLLPRSHGLTLQSAILSPPVLIFAFLFELALQGHRLNQEADEAHSDLERQALEQDASLLRSSSLLRHQEQLIAIDAERQRLLRDVQDGAGGVLTHLLLDVRRNRLTHSEIERGLQSALDDLRNIASAIDAGDEPIDEALAMFRERVAARLSRSGIVFNYRCVLPNPAPSLDARRRLSLYRLLQEGIANTLRHAQASRIDLTVEAQGEDAILITLSDNGTGFDPIMANGSPGEGRGLANMRRRASQMGGHLFIEGAPKLGTRLTLSVSVGIKGK